MNQPDEILDKWFGSDAWEQIMNDAGDGDADSIELMEQVNDQLCNLIFHLHNDSNHNKIMYEVSYFERLCDDFDVA